MNKVHAQGFFTTYKKTITSTIIALVIAGSGTAVTWIHNAYADDRYVQRGEHEVEDLRSQIQQIDNALFEIDQEISFSETDQARRKWQARKAYYIRQKEALKEKLAAQNNNHRTA